jgi:TolA-binding protein
MRLFIIFFSILLLSTSCIGKIQLKNSIASLEKQVAAQAVPKDSLLEPLMLAYTSYVRQYPEDDKTPIYLYKISGIYIRMQHWKEATKHLEFIIDKYTDSPVYPEALLLAAAAYEGTRGNNEERAGALYKIYLKKYPDGKGKAAAEFFFQPDDVKSRARIAEYQKQLYEDSGKGLNKHAAHVLVRQYLNYVKKYPNSEFSPTYCLEGGKLASTIGETSDAVELWLTIYDQYHDFHLYPETMLLLAVEYEVKMPVFLQSYNKKEQFKSRMHARLERYNLMATDWTKEAEKMYKAFLAKYPTHALAEQAQASLKYLGKTPNEVVNSFKNNLDSLRNTSNHNNKIQ